MKISLIAAMANNRVIGDQGTIPWKIRGEQQIFKDLTLGKIVIFGRKTYASIGRALPGRTTIVITRQLDLALPDAHVAHSLEEALAIALSLGNEVVIGGGAELYMQSLPIADVVYLTTVHQSFPGDALFPELPESLFRITSAETVDASIPYTFAIYERIRQHAIKP